MLVARMIILRAAGTRRSAYFPSVSSRGNERERGKENRDRLIVSLD